jgi:hypothetical protein
MKNVKWIKTILLCGIIQFAAFEMNPFTCEPYCEALFGFHYQIATHEMGTK